MPMWRALHRAGTRAFAFGVLCQCVGCPLVGEHDYDGYGLRSGGESDGGDADAAASCQRWRTVVAGVEVGGLTLRGTELVANGSKSGEGWVARFDPCSGALVRELRLMDTSWTGGFAEALMLAEGRVLVVGTGDTGGPAPSSVAFHAALNPASFAVERITTLSAEAQVAFGATLTSGGNLWLVGFGAVAGVQAQMVAKVASSGAACEMFDEPGYVNAVAAGDGQVYVAVSKTGSFLLKRYRDEACDVTDCSTCVPDATLELNESLTGWSLTYYGGKLYVAGVEGIPGEAESAGIVLALDKNLTQVEGRYAWNPTPGTDGFVAVVGDGQGLYVAGSQGWDLADPAVTAGVVMRLPLPLSMNASPDWETKLSSVVGVIALQVDSAEDAYYAVGAASPSAFLFRCRKSDGACTE